MNEVKHAGERCRHDETWRHVPMLSHHLQDLPVREYGSVQLEPGAVNWRAANALGRDTCMGRLQGSMRTTEYLVPSRGWTALLVPITWKQDYVVDGRRAGTGDIFAATDTNGYSGTWSQRDNLGLGFRTSRLKSTIATLAGRPDDCVQLTDTVLELGGKLGSIFRRRILTIWDSVTASPTSTGFHSIEAYAEQRLLEEAALTLLPFLPALESPSSTAKSDIAIVRSVYAYSEDVADLPSLSDLCALTGVGNSRLFESFMAVHGISPVRFLKRLRLTRARERLLDADNSLKSVKDVSISLGFRNGGRFASEYRNLFGEYPSQTLAQTLARRAAVD